jgi:uncharacterized repeat protein (TIGR01451 family)
MYRKTSLLLSVALVILGLAAALSVEASRAGAGDPPTAEPWSVKIIESDARHLLLELELTAFESETVEHAGLAYQRLRVADWGDWGHPGQPALPMVALPLGMPHPGTPRISLIAAESETLMGYRPRPVPALELGGTEDAPRIAETFLADAGAYSADTFYPGPLAEAAESGLLRDQPVFQLRLYPLQYNPQQQELQVYRRLRVLVTYPEAGRSLTEARVAETSPIFERILAATLLNYEALPQPALLPGAAAAAPLAVLDGPQVRLKVEADGLYRLTYGDLQALAPTLLQLDPRHLELTNRGVAVPIMFEGQADGSFDPGDSFIFYGQAIDSEYTRYNVYWLRDRGAPGARMAQRDGTPGAGGTPGAFADLRHYEQDHLYWQNRPDGEGEDHWFWSRLSVGGSTPVVEEYTFELHHLAGSGPAGEVQLALHGVTSGNHLTQVYLNGTALLSDAERAWVGPVEKVYHIPVSQSLFVEGTNRLRVENILPPSTTVSTVYVNWFEVTYQDTYVAEANLLRFGVPAADIYQFQVTDFTSNALVLFDVTDPAAPVRITNFAVEAAGSGYRLRFSDSAGPTQAYLAQRHDQLPLPILELDQPTTWRSPGNGATYIIITHPSFYDAVQPLAAYHQGQGETVVTVRTQDLYDEFYDGIYDPQAIRSFLEYAYQNWSPRPVYVLLIGDASSDPKNNRGSSLPDLLPVHYVDTPLFGQTPNDAWYTNVYGSDDYPDLIVGRIPARSAEEVTTVVNKVLVYESSPPSGNWMRQAVLVADDGDVAFTGDMDGIAEMLPAQINPVKMYAYDPSTSVPDRVNSGTLLLAYSGHGYLRGWASWSGAPDQIFNSLQVQGLSNGNRLPFMTVANCLNGYFADYYRARAMAEEFLLVNNKGGIASWASAAYGYPTSNTVIQGALYQALLVDGDRVLGSAATTARIQAHATRPDLPLSLFETFTYFGDPALRLNVPAELGLGGADAPDPVVMGEELTYTLSYTVSAADQARSLTLVDTLPQGVTYQSASPAPSSVYARTLTWNLGDTVAGEYQVTVVARMGTSGLAHGQTLDNQVHLYDANGGDRVLSIATTVHDRPIVGLSAGNDSPTWLGYPTTLSAATTSGTNVVYTWDFGDGSPTRTGASIQHTYPAVDTYTAQVTASNGAGSQSQTTVVTITDVPPDASFISSSPDRVGQTTTLESTSGGTNLTYQWDFGDGSPVASTQASAIDHVYGSVGSYQVVLTATNSAGTDVATGVVEILGQPNLPVASFTSSSPDELGQATRFTNTSQDGGDDAENISYTWHFGDGGSSTAKHPTHAYVAVGTYQASLTIDNSVGSDTFSAPVLITDAPIRGLAIQQDSPTFLGSATHLAARIDTGTNISYQWDLGDGSSASGPSLAHTYSALGSYTIVLTATNSVNHQVATATVLIEEQQIEGLALAHDGPTLLGHPTTFSATLSSGTNVAYRWDFGDGAGSSLQNPVHTYAAIGEYTVVLTATNSWGNQHRTDTVIVQDEPISGLQVSHDGPTVLGMPTTLNATVASGTNVVYTWDLGDGQVASGAHLTHTYAAIGEYELTLTAINSTSADEVSTTVNVVDQRSIYLPLVLRP